ncbi:uncharacterized protein LOC119560266 [Drosophila subpulchrella]|uniref:uncharacterized protein LOC119560266 n=1 Tax=Drosophila subpulchrella TaxID=1486046 RepID=UPI0018A14FF9|nr:uncharacterized protein LOC119560266 [Drosophila subpulchrella]
MAQANVLNYGIISVRECQCRGRNDNQMMNTEYVTNYGVMTTRKCQGETNPPTLKLKSFINRGILVLHKCLCNSELLQIDKLTNYGNLVICKSTCKLVKRNGLKAFESPENLAEIGSMKPGVTPQMSPGRPLDLSASSSVDNSTKENSFGKNLTNSREFTEAPGSSKNQLYLSVPTEVTDLPAITTNNPLKRQRKCTDTAENPPKKLCLVPANQSLGSSLKNTTNLTNLVSPNDPLKRPMESTETLQHPQKKLSLVLENNSSPHDLGPPKVETTAVQIPQPRLVVMCTPCSKDLHDYLSDPKNDELKPKKTKLRCPHCLNVKANKRDFSSHIATCQQEHKPYECIGCAYKSTKKSCVTGHSSTCFYLLSAKKFERRCLSTHHSNN